MFVLSRHLDLVSSSFAALPESTTLLPDQHAVTNAAVFWAVVPLTGAPSTNHAVGPFVGMIFLFIVTFVAWVNFLAAAEAEPPIAFCIVTATSTAG